MSDTSGVHQWESIGTGLKDMVWGGHPVEAFLSGWRAEWTGNGRNLPKGGGNNGRSWRIGGIAGHKQVIIRRFPCQAPFLRYNIHWFLMRSRPEGPVQGVP